MEDVIEILYKEDMLQIQAEEEPEDGEISVKGFYYKIRKELSEETLCLFDTMLCMIKSKQDKTNFETYRRGIKTGIRLMVQTQE